MKFYDSPFFGPRIDSDIDILEFHSNQVVGDAKKYHRRQAQSSVYVKHAALVVPTKWKWKPTGM